MLCYNCNGLVVVIINRLLSDTDHIDPVYAAADVPKPGLHHQQVRRSSISPDPRLQVHTLPGTQDSGTCEFLEPDCVPEKYSGLQDFVNYVK